MDKKKRIVAVFLAVTALFVMLCSALFIAAEADHDCVGNNCPICCRINACRDALKNLSLAVCASAVAAVFTYTVYKCVSACSKLVRAYTLVILKVKLSD